jgi:hypothetical protein
VATSKLDVATNRVEVRSKFADVRLSLDLRLLQHRVVAAANATRFLFAMSFLGAGLIFPLYFQQVLG